MLAKGTKKSAGKSEKTETIVGENTKSFGKSSKAPHVSVFFVLICVQMFDT